MITIIAIVAGGLACIGIGVWIGVVIGYNKCNEEAKALFQALIDQGQMVVRGDDEWVGMPEAFTSIYMRMGKDMPHD